MGKLHCEGLLVWWNCSVGKMQCDGVAVWRSCRMVELRCRGVMGVLTVSVVIWLVIPHP